MDYHYDEVDAPVRQRPKSKNTFQMELGAKLRQRRSQGLSADITTSEGSDEEDDLLEQYRRQKSLSSTSPKLQRPGSAKRRGDSGLNLGETLRPRDAENMFANANLGRDDSLDREVASYANKNLPRMGAKTPSPKLDSRFGRKTPTGKKTPEENLTKEELIFGRKTPTQEKGQGNFPDALGKKPWTPPSYQKPAGDLESRNRTPSPASSRGRNTPSSLLDPISEGTTPRGTKSGNATPRGDHKARPRLMRQPSADSDKSPRQLSTESSPRPVPRQRKAPDSEFPRKSSGSGIDLFGTRRMEIEPEEEIEKPEKEPRFRRQGAKSPARNLGGRKTPENLQGRKTPTGRKTPEFGRKTPAGRKTPTRRTSSTEQEVVEKKPESKSLLEMMTEESTAPTKAPRRRKSDLMKENSADSFSSEFQSDYRRSTSPVRRPLQPQRDNSFDKSSVCEEVERDPDAKKREAIQEAETTTKSGKQSSKQKALNSAISEVADAQSKVDNSKKEEKKRPKTGDGKHKPKPRYPTMPGEATPPVTEINFEDTTSIREAIYRQWYEERMEKSKKSLLEKKKKEKEEEEKKKQEKEEKAVENELSYKAWVEKKKDTFFKEKRKMKTKEEMKREKEIEEKEEKRKLAEKSFEIWKERKGETIQEKTKRLKQTEAEKKQAERELKEERLKNSESAFSGWKKKKDVVLKNRAREEKKLHKQKQREEEEKKIEKDEDAMQRYEEWLRNKTLHGGRDHDQERKDKYNRHGQTRRYEEEDDRPPWSPANKTIPFGR